ncbi:NAD(+) synthase [Granulibacter bethesdensis]|uniref:NAD(+) synthase n=1 Tax=Granulibacter bethesdensis TaxID=364410 RepID=UPI000909AE95|nr:Glutamine-dependent NAD(+) synthetase [Granulibacter bethesdensis]
MEMAVTSCDNGGMSHVEQRPFAPFSSLYSHGLVRVAACVPPVHIANPARNADEIAALAMRADAQGVAVAVFPELCLSGYAIDDLVQQDVLLDAVDAAIGALLRRSAGWMSVIVIGAPVRQGGRLFNAAIVLHRGRVLGVVPKSYLPNYREFYERRHFTPGLSVQGQSIRIGDEDAPFGTDLLFAAEDVEGLILHVEICEDMWMPVSPASLGALNGATVLANLSGSPITIGRADSRTLLSRSASMRCVAATVYAAAGWGESTTDLAWDGQATIYENGTLLAETPRFAQEATMAVADIDPGLLMQERMRVHGFEENRRAMAGAAMRRIGFRLDPPSRDLGLRRRVERFPFVPADPARLAQDCYEAYNIQVRGLAQRLSAAKIGKLVIGVSGGLDSTHALIVAARAMDVLQRPRSDILAYTMPGFATGDETRNNALALMRVLGVSAHELDIRPAARQMLADLEHPFAGGEQVYDITFENVQAGLRTDYLFRLANQHNGIVLGTGDLSELALGWCTYGVGDQMSHYNVNAGVPKTLIQHLIRWAGGSGDFSDEARVIFEAILNTEISPELIPVAEGEKPQSTEGTIGPYALHDFTLFHVLRYGFRPSKIAFLAWHAWHDAQQGVWPPNYPLDQRRSYDLADIRQWMQVFLKRFFGFSQFKRSALPNGPKISAGGALSPRGDWRAPSDGSAEIWLQELAAHVPDDFS